MVALDDPPGPGGSRWALRHHSDGDEKNWPQPGWALWPWDPGLTGLAGVPSGAKAVVVNLTAVAPTLGTFLTVYPGGIRPLASDLNPAAHDVKGNLTVATLSAGGTITVFNSVGGADVVVDVLGWYS
jgi:hypothetical protein